MAAGRVVTLVRETVGWLTSASPSPSRPVPSAGADAAAVAAQPANATPDRESSPSSSCDVLSSSPESEPVGPQLKGAVASGAARSGVEGCCMRVSPELPANARTPLLAAARNVGAAAAASRRLAAPAPATASPRGGVWAAPNHNASHTGAGRESARHITASAQPHDHRLSLAAASMHAPAGQAFAALGTVTPHPLQVPGAALNPPPDVPAAIPLPPPQQPQQRHACPQQLDRSRGAPPLRVPHPMPAAVYPQVRPPTANVSAQNVQPHAGAAPGSIAQPLQTQTAVAEHVQRAAASVRSELEAQHRVNLKNAETFYAQSNANLKSRAEAIIQDCCGRLKRMEQELAATRGDLRLARHEAAQHLENWRQWESYAQRMYHDADAARLDALTARRELKHTSSRAQAAETKLAELQQRLQDSFCLTGAGLNLVSDFPSLSDLGKQYCVLMTETRGELIEHLLAAAGHAQASRDAEARLMADGEGASPSLAPVSEHTMDGFISALTRECYAKAQRRVDNYVHRLKWMLRAGGTEQCTPPIPPPAPAQQCNDSGGKGGGTAAAFAGLPNPHLDSHSSQAAAAAVAEAEATDRKAGAAKPAAGSSDPHRLVVDALFRYLRQNACATSPALGQVVGGARNSSSCATATAAVAVTTVTDHTEYEAAVTERNGIARSVFDACKQFGGWYVQELSYEGNAAAEVRRFIDQTLHLCWLLRISSPPVAMEWRDAFSAEWYVPSYDSAKDRVRQATDAAEAVARAHAAGTGAAALRPPKGRGAVAPAPPPGPPAPPLRAVLFPALVADARVIAKGEVRL